MTDETNHSDPGLDRPSESATSNRKSDVPWSVEHPRGALNVEKDGSQHRRYHTHFEDLMN